MKPVFISYMHENTEIVDRLCQELTSRGIEVWLDRNDINPGSRWKQEIRTAIREGAFFIACFSREYNHSHKTYMNEELTIAIEELRQRPTDRVWFIPVKLNRCKIPDRNVGADETLKDLQYVNLYKDWDAGIQRIIEVIQSESSEPTEDENTNSKFSGNFADQNRTNTKSSHSNRSQNRDLTDWVFQQGNFLIRHNQIDGAIEAYSHGINLDPYRPVAYREFEVLLIMLKMTMIGPRQIMARQ